MTTLFSPVTIGSLTLANRFVRSATWEGMAQADGSVTQQLMETMAALADGQVGLIITGHAYVEACGQASPKQLGIHEDNLVHGHRQMVSAVHARGGKIAIQLAHAGRRATPDEVPLHAMRVFKGLPTSTEPDAPKPPKPMGISELKEVVQAFGKAARRAKEAGYDAVQIHGAHGYLISQSLSGLENPRTDWYGGAIGHRMHLLLEIVTAVRTAVGEGYPILVKLNSSDHVEGGLTLEESVAVAKALEEAGISAIEVSGGVPESGEMAPIRTKIDGPDKEGYFHHAGRAFKEALSIPVMVVGGMRSLSAIESFIGDGSADLISMSRPFVREPGLIRRWQKGDTEPSRCVSCCRCFVPARKGKGIYCPRDHK